jgi:hypothetical protein
MNTLLLKLVATNAGWIARNVLKLSTIITAATAAFLIGKGVESQLSTAISIGAGSAFLWIIEAAASFIARRYAVQDSVAPVLDAIKRGAPLVIAFMAALLLSSCSNGQFLGLTGNQWGNIALETGKTIGKQVPSAALNAYTNEKLKSGKQPLPSVNPAPQSAEPETKSESWFSGFRFF